MKLEHRVLLIFRFLRSLNSNTHTPKTKNATFPHALVRRSHMTSGQKVKGDVDIVGILYFKSSYPENLALVHYLGREMQDRMAAEIEAPWK